MKTLYEILEVSENASKEIIEKAYRVLAKRYHPDLQKEEDKLNAEKKMKEINEAYGILSNDAKRKEYNEKLAYERQKEQESKIQYAENEAYYQSQSKNYSNENIRKEEYQSEKKRQQEEIKNRKKMQEDLQAQYEQRYQNAYENYLRSLGYKIKYKWTWKDYKRFFIIILVLVAICTLIWLFPPTNKMLMDFYNSNPLIKTVIDIIIGIIRGIWNAICSAFTSFF